MWGHFSDPNDNTSSNILKTRYKVRGAEARAQVRCMMDLGLSLIKKKKKIEEILFSYKGKPLNIPPVLLAIRSVGKRSYAAGDTDIPNVLCRNTNLPTAANSPLDLLLPAPQLSRTILQDQFLVLLASR